MIGRKIGEGAFAEVFEWVDESGADLKVLKLARSPHARQAILEEFHHNQLAWDMGLPVPRAYDLVEAHGRAGILLERVSGNSVLDRLVEEVVAQVHTPTHTHTHSHSHGYELTRALKDFRLLARMLARIHGQTADYLRSQRDDIRDRLQRVDDLTAAEKSKILAILDSLPEKNQLCHGDPHPGNLLIHGERATMIDWMDATLGSPEAEVADLVVLVRYSSLPPGLPPGVAERISSTREPIVQEFLEEYERLTGTRREAVDAWIAPMAARRLTMGILGPEDKQMLLTEIRRRLSVD